MGKLALVLWSLTWGWNQKWPQKLCPLEVHLWANWLHNHSRHGGPQVKTQVKVGTRGGNEKWLNQPCCLEGPNVGTMGFTKVRMESKLARSLPASWGPTYGLPSLRVPRVETKTKVAT